MNLGLEFDPNRFIQTLTPTTTDEISEEPTTIYAINSDVDEKRKLIDLGLDPKY